MSRFQVRPAAFGIALLGICVFVGCPKPAATPVGATSSSGANEKTRDDGPSTPLQLIVVDDPPLAAALGQEWRTISEEPLEIRELTTREVASATRLPPADAVVYPTGLLGTLAERNQILRLPDDYWNSGRLERRTLLETARKREAVWGEQPYAVPLGGPTPVLLYRADIFEVLNLSPPTTWSEFQAIVPRLSTREDLGRFAPPTGEAWNGVLEPLAQGSAAGSLLLRAAAYARHRNQYSTLFDFVTMDPLIDGPPFVQALEELVAAHGMNPGPALELDVEGVRRELLAGRSALAITWPSPVAAAKASAEAVESRRIAGEDADAPRFAIAMIPGSTNVYNASQKKWEPRSSEDSTHVPVLALSGRLGSVTRSSRRAQAAANLLAMLSTADWSVRVLTASDGTGMSRTGHVQSPDRWVDAPLAGEPARQYASVVKEIQKSPTWLMVSRIPGRDRYLAALDDAVRAAVRSEQTPVEALQVAAAKWRDITQEFGVEAQKTAYRRCLGVEPASPSE